MEWIAVDVQQHDPSHIGIVRFYPIGGKGCLSICPHYGLGTMWSMDYTVPISHWLTIPKPPRRYVNARGWLTTSNNHLPSYGEVCLLYSVDTQNMGIGGLYELLVGFHNYTALEWRPTHFLKLPPLPNNIQASKEI